jgi:hypothetical protein
MTTGSLKQKTGLRDIAGTDINPATSDKQDSSLTVLQNIADLDFSTKTKQDEIISKLGDVSGFDIPRYDEIDIRYVPSGNGVGEIQYVIYSYHSVMVSMLTLTYNSSNKLINVTQARTEDSTTITLTPSIVKKVKPKCTETVTLTPVFSYQLS